MPDMYDKPRMEDFEAVMLPKNISVMEAKPEDFVRVAISASDPLSAILSDAVQAKSKEGGGFIALFAAKPGMLTDPEMQARSRAAASHDVDRSKL